MLLTVHIIFPYVYILHISLYNNIKFHVYEICVGKLMVMGIGIRMWAPSSYGDCDLSYYLEGMGTGSIVPYPLPSLAYVPSPVHQIQR